VTVEFASEARSTIFRPRVFLHPRQVPPCAAARPSFPVPRSLPTRLPRVPPRGHSPLTTCPLFSCTYELPNLQALCFYIDTTVPGVDTHTGRKMTNHERKYPRRGTLTSTNPVGTHRSRPSASRLPLPASLPEWHAMPSSLLGFSFRSLFAPLPHERRSRSCVVP